VSIIDDNDDVLTSSFVTFSFNGKTTTIVLLTATSSSKTRRAHFGVLNISTINLEKNESRSLCVLFSPCLLHPISNTIAITTTTNLRRVDGRAFPLGRTRPDDDTTTKKKNVKQK
jgi:hypothetical protein